MSQIKRNIPDAQWSKYTLHPAQNTTAYSTSFDLVLAGNVSRESLEVVLGHDAAPSLAAAQTIILTLQDSADDVNFADVAALGSSTQTGAGGGGAVAVSTRRMLPSSIRQYIRTKVVTSATTGDNTAVGHTLQLVF